MGTGAALSSEPVDGVATNSGVKTENILNVEFQIPSSKGQGFVLSLFRPSTGIRTSK